MDQTTELIVGIIVIVIAFPIIIWDVRRRWKSGKTDFSVGDGGE